MNIKQIKLGQLSRHALEANKMKHLKGAVYYCYWGDENKAANESQGKCSCNCADNTSYYNTSHGLSSDGNFTRANW